MELEIRPRPIEESALGAVPNFEIRFSGFRDDDESLLPHCFLNFRHRYRALSSNLPRIAIQLHDG